MNIEANKKTIYSSIVGLTSVLVLIGLFFGAFQFIDTTYAQNKELDKLNTKVDIKILDDRSQALQQRLWSLEDRKISIESRPVDPFNTEYRALMDQIRETESQKERVDKELDIVIEKHLSVTKEKH